MYGYVIFPAWACVFILLHFVFLTGIHSLMTHTDAPHLLIHTMTDSAMILTGKKDIF